VHPDVKNIGECLPRGRWGVKIPRRFRRYRGQFSTPVNRLNDIPAHQAISRALSGNALCPA